MAMTMMSLPHSYYPPSYSDNTTIMLAIVFRRPSSIPDARARERLAENRWIIANIWQFITCTSYVMISFHLSSLIGHFEHGLTIRNGRIHRISERRHKDLTAAVNALLSAVERAFLRSKIIFTAVDISSSCAADEALKQLSILRTCHDECNNQLAASLHRSNGSQWIEFDFILCNLFWVMLNDIYWSNGTVIDLEA